MVVEGESTSSVVSETVSEELCSCKNLWRLHGKSYDFADFVERHPGGDSFILLGKGRDCTELFESVHQLSKMDLNLIVEKYRQDCPVHATNTPDDNNASLFDWAPTGLFFQLRDEVRTYFETKKVSHKANVLFWIAAGALLSTIVYCYQKWIKTSSMMFACFAGALSMLFNFMVMHSASHGALSKYSWVNWGVYSFWSDWMAWPHFIWLQHHVYGHHSFTGVYGKDPDMRNMTPFARKSFKQPGTYLMKFQHWLGVLVMTIFPNQHIGQILVYVQTFFRKKLFGMPVFFKNITRADVLVFVTVETIMITLLVINPICLNGFTKHIVSLIAYFVCGGICYWAVVFPNHDTHETLVNNTKSVRDWAEAQIRHSTNFKLPEFLAQLVGGMNYQIEHHLFPTVHPIHYASLSKVVQKFCKKNGIPYVMHASWFSAFKSHLRFLKKLSTDCYHSQIAIQKPAAF